MKINSVRAWTTLLLTAFLGACIRRAPPLPALEVTLFRGIQQIAQLQDNEADIKKKAETLKTSLEPVDISQRPDLQALKIEKVFFLKDIGMRVYLRQGRVALLEIQVPFHGQVVGRGLQLFPFTTPAQVGNTQRNWEDILVKEFGPPRAAVSGGKLASQSLFYPWGDIAFNGMGPNQLAIYRDEDLGPYREKNFGRVLTLFQGN